MRLTLASGRVCGDHGGMHTRKSWRVKLRKFQKPRLVEVRENEAAGGWGSG